MQLRLITCYLADKKCHRCPKLIGSLNADKKVIKVLVYFSEIITIGTFYHNCYDEFFTTFNNL